MAEKRKIAIITARGGSKRIPKKNIKEFCGLPIIAYSIRTAQNEKNFGHNVQFMRSSYNSDVFSYTEDVIL